MGDGSSKSTSDILNLVYDRIKKALRVEAELKVEDIEIGAVEIKDGATDERAGVVSNRLLVQVQDEIKDLLDEIVDYTSGISDLSKEATLIQVRDYLADVAKETTLQGVEDTLLDILSAIDELAKESQLPDSLTPSGNLKVAIEEGGGEMEKYSPRFYKSKVQILLDTVDTLLKSLDFNGKLEGISLNFSNIGVELTIEVDGVEIFRETLTNLADTTIYDLVNPDIWSISSGNSGKHFYLKFNEAVDIQSNLTLKAKKTAIGIPDVYALYHLNSLNGFIAYDSSGNGRDGVLTNMEESDWVVGKLNNCLQFDGVNEFVNCGQIAGFERNVPFSVDGWFKQGVSKDGLIICKDQNVSPYRGWGVNMLISGAIRFFLINNTNNRVDVQTNQIFNDNVWHYFAISYNGSSSASGVKVYIDGILRAITTSYDNLTDTILIANNLSIGARDNGVGGIQGWLDELAIYTKVLTAEEVLARWNGGQGIELTPISPIPDVGMKGIIINYKTKI